jgi:hypothetical protein
MLNVLSHSQRVWAIMLPPPPIPALLSIVEQQMDLVAVVAIRHLISEPLHPHSVGHMRVEAQALWQSRRFTEPVRLRHTRRRDVAHRDIAPFRD